MSRAPDLIQSIKPARTISRLSSFLWWLMLIMSLGIVGYGASYFFMIPGNAHFVRYLLPLRFHIAGGMGALLTGPFQFSRRLRARAINVHRWVGRVYLLSVLTGSVAGFLMSLVSMEGLATHLGFGSLAILWFATGLVAYVSVRRGEVEAHRRWMIRNFALTLAAVTLRNWMPLMMFALHWPFHTTYVVVSWLCWVPNLLIAEWILIREDRVSFREA